MARCAQCGTETGLYEDGSRICIDCADSSSTLSTRRRALNIAKLNEDLIAARENYKHAQKVQRLAMEVLESKRNDPNAMVALSQANFQFESAARKFRDSLRDLVQAISRRRESE